MSLNQMSLNQMSLNQMSLNQVSLNQMSLNQMSSVCSIQYLTYLFLGSTYKVVGCFQDEVNKDEIQKHLIAFKLSKDKCLHHCGHMMRYKYFLIKVIMELSCELHVKVTLSYSMLLTLTRISIPGFFFTGGRLVQMY